LKETLVLLFFWQALVPSPAQAISIFRQSLSAGVWSACEEGHADANLDTIVTAEFRGSCSEGAIRV